MDIALLFYFFAFLSIVGSLGLLIVKQPVHGVLYFIITLLSLAALYALLSNTFLFTVQIILYTGAIITILLFVIMFLNIKEENIPEEKHIKKYIVFVLAILSPMIYFVFYAIMQLEVKPLNLVDPGFGSVENIGKTLFSNWIFPFELISILLLVALIGVIVLGKGARVDNKH